jgi:hypothetical protein
MCKHVAQVERRAEREGWAFGAVAPLAIVARYFPLDDADPEPPASPAADSAPVAVDFAAVGARGRRALADLFGG